MRLGVAALLVLAVLLAAAGVAAAPAARRPCPRFVAGPVAHRRIPALFCQTIRNKAQIPAEFRDNVREFTAGYEHVVADNRFQRDFVISVLGSYGGAALDSMKQGCHRADLFRYCWLYRHGGVYLDVKSKFLTPLAALHSAIEEHSCGFATALSNWNGLNNLANNGFLAAEPGHPLMREAMLHAARHAAEANQEYHLFCRRLRELIGEYCGRAPREGPNPQGVFLITEEMVEPAECPEKLDHAGFCSYLSLGSARLLKTRPSGPRWWG